GVLAEAAVQSGHSDRSGHEDPHFVHAEALRVRGTRKSRYEDSLDGRQALRRRWVPILMTDSPRRVNEAGSRTSGPQATMSMSSAGRSWGLASWCGTSPGACAQSPACSVVRRSMVTISMLPDRTKKLSREPLRCAAKAEVSLCGSSR